MNPAKLAKADIVPTETNLRASSSTFSDLEAACNAFMTSVNTRVHRTTRRVPTEMLTQEVLRLHPIPTAPHAITFGETGQVPVDNGDGHLPERVLLGAAPAAGRNRVGAGPRRRPRRTKCVHGTTRSLCVNPS